MPPYGLLGLIQVRRPARVPLRPVDSAQSHLLRPRRGESVAAADGSNRRLDRAGRNGNNNNNDNRWLRHASRSDPDAQR